MANTEATPISPVDAANKPEISISAAPVNNEPVELDSTPTSPEEQRRRRGSKEENVSAEEQEVGHGHAEQVAEFHVFGPVR